MNTKYMIAAAAALLTVTGIVTGAQMIRTRRAKQNLKAEPAPAADAQA